MIRNSKSILTIGAIVAALLVPAVQVDAVVTPTPTDSDYCQRIKTAGVEAEATLDKKVESLATSRSSKDTQLTEKRAAVDGKLQTSRQEADKKRDEAMAKLLLAAKDDSEKLATQQYIDSVKGALEQRRTANDKARLSFRQGVDALVSEHRKSVDAQVTEFKTSVKTAMAIGNTNCRARPAGLSEAIKEAKSQYKIARSSDVKLGEQIKALAATRNAEIKANDATAKATIEQARTVLKAALVKE